MNRRSRSGLFLLEFLSSLLIFALCAAVCMQLFAAAHGLTRRTRAENKAALLAQSTAACIQSQNGDLDAACRLMGGSGPTLYFDENGDAAPQAEAAFTLTVLPAADAERADLAVSWQGETLLTLSCGWHTPLVKGGGTP